MSFPPKLPPQSPPDLPSEINSNARTRVRTNSGADVGQRRRMNIVGGSGVSVAAVDDGENEEVRVTLTNSSPGVTDHGALTGLGDDDHPQYTTDAEATTIAAGEVATHSADTTSVHGITNTANLLTTSTSFAGDVSGTSGALVIGNEKCDVATIGTDFPRCSVARTTDQLVNTGTFTAITFPTEIYDPQGMHASNSASIVVPRAGLYCVAGELEVETAGEDIIIEAQLFISGGNAFAHSRQRAEGVVDPTIISVAGQIELSASDAVQLLGWNDSGFVGKQCHGRLAVHFVCNT